MQNETRFLDMECSLEAVIRLVEQRDVRGLNSVFLSVLEGHLPARKIQVYQLYLAAHGDNHLAPGSDELRLLFESGAAGSHPELTLDEPDVQQCLRENHYVTGTFFASEKPYTIFPIPGTDETLGFLVIADKLDKIHARFLEPLLRIYANQAFLLKQSEHDTLTGLLNRQALDVKLNQLYQSTRTGNRQTDNSIQDNCFALLDIDHFKRINDKFGHIYGDEVLLLFARVLEKSFRDRDMLFRYGGEEFVIVLRDIDMDKAEIILNRFRNKVSQIEFAQAGKITVSIGITSLDASVPIPTLIDCADKALYYAKNHGRNQVARFEQLVESGSLDPSNISSGEIELFYNREQSL